VYGGLVVLLVSMSIVVYINTQNNIFQGCCMVSCYLRIGMHELKSSPPLTGWFLVSTAGVSMMGKKRFEAKRDW